MTDTRNSSITNTRSKHQWRVVDIVVASVVAVASGVIFWAWGLAWNALSLPLAFLPGLSGLLAGGWLFAGVLGALIIRKPGAALFTEIMAAFVSMAIGTEWGWATLVSGLIQGAAIELVFLVFLYANWGVVAAILAGAAGGAALGINENLVYYAANDAMFKTIYLSSTIVSGIVLAGLLSWFAVRGLAATGALSRFAAGREQSQRV
ncbi:MAG TPA: ECF transporter S component [Homoserinimonas sp.]|nr:ECF transporter S component [Homoserinimonas sp.]